MLTFYMKRRTNRPSSTAKGCKRAPATGARHHLWRHTRNQHCHGGFGGWDRCFSTQFNSSYSAAAIRRHLLLDIKRRPALGGAPKIGEGCS